jgi:hypothetical protein
MQFREIIAVYSGDCTKNINIFCEQNTNFIVKVGSTESNQWALKS